MNTSYLVQIWEYVYSHIAMCRLCILLTSGMISALCMLPLFFLHGPELSSVFKSGRFHAHFHHFSVKLESNTCRY